MSKNFSALLIAGALILLSALEISYLSTRSTENAKRVTLPLDESRTNRACPRAVVSVQGLPAQVALDSLPERMAQPEPPVSQE